MLSKNFLVNWLSRMFLIAIAFVVSVALVSYTQPCEAALIAALPSTTAIKDARILLRQALPIDNAQIRDIQLTLEKFPRQANLKRWGNMSSDVDKIIQSLTQQSDKILASVASAQQEAAIATLADLNKTLVPLQEAIAAKDRNSIKPLSEKSLDYVGILESQMVQSFPFHMPTYPSSKAERSWKWKPKRDRLPCCLMVSAPLLTQDNSSILSSKVSTMA
jgi:peptidylprolyl isomerase